MDNEYKVIDKQGKVWRVTAYMEKHYDDETVVFYNNTCNAVSFVSPQSIELIRKDVSSEKICTQWKE